jgi:hypothetical protein
MIQYIKEALGYTIAIIMIFCLGFLGMSPKAGTFTNLDVFVSVLVLILLIIFVELTRGHQV